MPRFSCLGAAIVMDDQSPRPFVPAVCALHDPSFGQYTAKPLLSATFVLFQMPPVADVAIARMAYDIDIQLMIAAQHGAHWPS